MPINIYLLFLVGCGRAPSVMRPSGPAAERIAALWWLLLGLGTAVFVAVMALLAFGLWRRTEMSAEGGRRFVLWGGALIPTLVLLIVYTFNLSTLRALSAPLPPKALVIEVIAHQFWWEVRYPEQKVLTANEIHIPVGQAVEIKLASDDVIHSFWVPELHGKRDMIPGQTNTLRLEAAAAGEYRGICAEFCGVQHAKMLFWIIAQEEAEFEAWLAQRAEPAQPPTDALEIQGFEIFMSAECGSCHRIDGTTAEGNLGPDLTHFASRQSLGAGILPNTPANLAQWILDPQTIKKGNLMPATPLSDSDLQALLAYLETLE